MAPIVDGLESVYQAEVEFIRLNAAVGDGLDTFQYYGLPGHPSYLLLSPAGDVLWTGAGEIPAQSIEQEILLSLEK